MQFQSCDALKIHLRYNYTPSDKKDAILHMYLLFNLYYYCNNAKMVGSISVCIERLSSQVVLVAIFG